MGLNLALWENPHKKVQASKPECCIGHGRSAVSPHFIDPFCARFFMLTSICVLVFIFIIWIILCAPKRFVALELNVPRTLHVNMNELGAFLGEIFIIKYRDYFSIDNA